MNYVLVNAKSGNGSGETYAREWAEKLNDKKIVSVLEIEDMHAFFDGLKEEDVVYLSGGDGTVNHFVNDLYGYPIKNQIYYMKSGSGNDFFHDAEEDAKDGMISLNRYMENLPLVEVNGIKRRFVNGIGYGLDGEACRVGEEQRKVSSKPVNYTKIAIKLLLLDYRLKKATITVDGKVSIFKNVWLAPTMKGRYYGGGMKVAPEQDRFNAEGTVTVCCLHKRSRLGTLMQFPAIFTGELAKNQKIFTAMRGKEIKVEFDQPCALQIDGEVVENVTSYVVRA